jgi:hypothetical protein|tara:strand:+ start:602 stop:754 length:153 start_codon:yes stop_codon:yes gene_type:complete
MNEDLTKFLLERISALENQNRELTNSNLIKTEKIEELRIEVNYLNNTKKL